MTITITDDSHTLLELLWIREARQLRPSGEDLPPELIDTPEVVDDARRASAPIVEWQAAWPALWAACVRHAGKPSDPDLVDRLVGSEFGSPERAHIFDELVGPSWHDRFGDQARTTQENDWEDRVVRERLERTQSPWEEQPERLALEPLIRAWRSGLTNIVEIPCRGTFTRVIGQHALLVTSETRADADRYSEALAEFP